jgi:hypothetical protein
MRRIFNLSVALRADDDPSVIILVSSTAALLCDLILFSILFEVFIGNVRTKLLFYIFFSVLYVKLPRRLIHFSGLSALFSVKNIENLNTFFNQK